MPAPQSRPSLHFALRVPRIFQVIGFSVLGGAASGMAAFLGMFHCPAFANRPPYISPDFVDGLAASDLAGATVGCLASPFLMLALYTTSLRRALPWVYFPTFAVAFLLGVFPQTSGLEVLLSVPLFILMAFIARAALPSLEPSEGLCPNCGYNLTGNTSGKCPECGNRPHAVYKS